MSGLPLSASEARLAPTRRASWKRVDVILLLTLALTIFALGPLLQPGYFWGAHDARHSVYFLFEFDRSIQEGILYPRWAPDFTFGYGYPFFNIYAPLASYVGEAFHLIGFNFVDSVKIVFGLSIVLSGMAMYLFLRRLMGRPAALLGGLAYVYLPYHLFDMYVRAALAESAAFVFMPLALWGFHETVTRPRIGAVMGAGLAYAALMFSSNLIALMFTPLLALYVGLLILARVNDSQPIRQWSKESAFPLLGHLLHVAGPPLFAILVGLGLSAIFWLPAITEASYVRSDQWLARYDYHEDFVYFFQLFSPQWGFDTSGAGPNDGVGFQLGAVPTALAMLSFIALRWIKRAEIRRLMIFSQVLLVGLIFMTTAPAAWIWDTFSFTRFAQFPWRYFALTTPLLAILSGAALVGRGTASALQAEARGPDRRSWSSWAATLVLATAILLSSYPYLQAEIRAPAEGPVSLASLMRFQHQSDHMTGSTIWTKEIPTWSPMADIWLNGEEVTTKVDYSLVPQNETLAVDSRELSSVHEKVWVWAGDDQQQVRFYRFYYPGWKAYILDETTEEIIEETPITPTGPQGLITVAVPQGRHFLLLRFEATWPRVLGQAASTVTLVGLLALVALRLGFRRLREVRVASVSRQDVPSPPGAGGE